MANSLGMNSYRDRVHQITDALDKMEKDFPEMDYLLVTSNPVIKEGKHRRAGCVWGSGRIVPLVSTFLDRNPNVKAELLWGMMAQCVMQKTIESLSEVNKAKGKRKKK